MSTSASLCHIIASQCLWPAAEAGTPSTDLVWSHLRPGKTTSQITWVLFLIWYTVLNAWSMGICGALSVGGMAAISAFILHSCVFLFLPRGCLRDAAGECRESEEMWPYETVLSFDLTGFSMLYALGACIPRGRLGFGLWVKCQGNLCLPGSHWGHDRNSGTEPERPLSAWSLQRGQHSSSEGSPLSHRPPPADTWNSSLGKLALRYSSEVSARQLWLQFKMIVLKTCGVSVGTLSTIWMNVKNNVTHCGKAGHVACCCCVLF